MLYSYVPSQVKCRVFGIELEGLSETNIASIERDTDATTFRKATDGSHTAFLDRFGSYKVTFHVNQVSESNSWLHMIFKLYQKAGVELKIPIEIEEVLETGGTRFTAFDCFFVTEPTTDFTNESDVKQWVFMCHNGVYTQRGTYESNELYEKLQTIIRMLELSQAVGLDLSSFTDKIADSVETVSEKLKSFI